VVSSNRRFEMADSKDTRQQDIQGEGDKRSARRFNQQEEAFVERSDTEALGREAKPKSREEAEELERAEAEAGERAKEHDPNEVRRQGPA
jgi:hypothetical protein